MKKLAYIISILFIIVFVGCAGGNKDITGRYMKEGSKDTYIELKADKTYIMRYSNDTNGTYTGNYTTYLAKYQGENYTVVKLGRGWEGGLGEGEFIVDMNTLISPAGSQYTKVK